MLRRIGWWMAWMLAIALPLQSVAAVARLHCDAVAAVHAHAGADPSTAHAHRDAHQAARSAPGADHPGHHAHHTGQPADSPGPAADAATPDGALAQADADCSACAACCAGGVLPSFSLRIEPETLADRYAAAPCGAAARFCTDGPDRPPRTLAA